MQNLRSHPLFLKILHVHFKMCIWTWKLELCAHKHKCRSPSVIWKCSFFWIQRATEADWSLFSFTSSFHFYTMSSSLMHYVFSSMQQDVLSNNSNHSHIGKPLCKNARKEWVITQIAKISFVPDSLTHWEISYSHMTIVILAVMFFHTNGASKYYQPE